MSFDPGFLAATFHRSLHTGRVYLVQHGLVVGEVPREAERALPEDQVRAPLGVEAELEYLWRKLGNLERYGLDLRQFEAAGPRLPLRSAVDFRLSEVARPHGRQFDAAFYPRIVQLGTTGCYTYAGGGWRHLLAPAGSELEILRAIPRATLVADAGLPAFTARERALVHQELDAERGLKDQLARHLDRDPSGGRT